MPTFVGLYDQVYVAHLDLTSHANEVDFGPLTRQMKDCTTFADAPYTCVKPGLITGSATVKGYQDFDLAVLDDQISAGQVGSQYAVTVIPNSSGTVAAGDPCWMSRGVLNALNPLSGAVGDMGGFELDFGYDTAILPGLVASPKTTSAADVTGTAVALTGPSATQKLYAALHVTAFSGFSSVVFTIESDDNSGFTSATTRATFATVAGTTSEFASVAGDFSTETYHRIKAVKTGTGSVTFAAFFGVL